MKVRHQNLYLADLGRDDVYVLADTAADAGQKAQEYIDELTTRVISHEGDLLPKEVKDVKVVRMMATKVIY